MSYSQLKKFSRLRLSLLPTPLHRLEKLSARYEADIWCKRDDLTGFGAGGNKTRKLDFLIADALEKRVDTIIASGATQSNFCRMAAAAATANGLAAHLVLGGSRPSKSNGNILLDRLFGAQLHFHDTRDVMVLEGFVENLAQRLRRRGKEVYILRYGGSTPIGCLGYVAGFLEIMEQSSRLRQKFDIIFHTSSSGGTQAGLAVGQTLAGWRGKIIGISADKKSVALTERVTRLAEQTASLLDINIKKEIIITDDGYVGGGYAARTAAAEAALSEFAREEGILLDHVYTAKSAAGLLDYAKTGKLKGKKTLFLHTGGSIELFE